MPPFVIQTVSHLDSNKSFLTFLIKIYTMIASISGIKIITSNFPSKITNFNKRRHLLFFLSRQFFN